MGMTWAQFVSQPNGTRVYNHGYDQCVAVANQYHENVIGGSFVGVSAAFQWWTNFGSYATLGANYTQVSGNPQAGDIFVARYGIYNAQFGHIGVVTRGWDGSTFGTAEQNAERNRYFYQTYNRSMANILGFLRPKNNPANVPIAATQRKVGNNPVKRRQGPSTSSAELPDPLQPGTVGNFNGWIYGEQVNDGVANTNIWYRGTSGNFFWAGGFTEINGHDLENLNPVAPTDPAERVVGSNPARRRKDASTSAAEVGAALLPNAKQKFTGFKIGEKVTDSVASTDIWYSVDGWFSWAGAFTKISTDGLTEIKPVPPTPEPPTPVPPTPEPPTPSGRKPVSETTPNWDMSAPAANPTYPRPVPATTGVVLPDTITERVEAVSVNGYTVGRPEKPNHIVLHHAASDSLSGVINTLRGTSGAPTASYAVKDRELVSMVAEQDSPWTNGRWTSNMYSVTFEMCNASGSSTNGWFPPSAETCETTAWAMARAAQRWGMELPLEHGVNVFGHKEVSKTATSCPGALDIDSVVKRANEIIAKYPVPAPEPTPSADFEAIAKLHEQLAVEFRKL